MELITPTGGQGSLVLFGGWKQGMRGGPQTLGKRTGQWVGIFLSWDWSEQGPTGVEAKSG